MSKAINTRMKALELLLKWTVECDFGYDNLGELYEEYEEELEKQDLGYTEGLIWIAEQVVEKNESNSSKYRDNTI